jgi:hypothetical protein
MSRTKTSRFPLRISRSWHEFGSGTRERFVRHRKPHGFRYEFSALFLPLPLGRLRVARVHEDPSFERAIGASDGGLEAETKFCEQLDGPCIFRVRECDHAFLAKGVVDDVQHRRRGLGRVTVTPESREKRKAKVQIALLLAPQQSADADGRFRRREFNRERADAVVAVHRAALFDVRLGGRAIVNVPVADEPNPRRVVDEFDDEFGIDRCQRPQREARGVNEHERAMLKR